MEITFYKYQGTGNDFIMVDNRAAIFPKNDTLKIEALCDRRFGIGADGLILLENDKFSDFRMVYFNSDGNESTMCGNGGRCLTAFAKQLGIISANATFMAIDGMHTATIDSVGLVSLQMKDVESVQNGDGFVFLDTGSPHHVQMVDDLKIFDVRNEGSKIRNSELYGKIGSNVNFVAEEEDGVFSVRTFERGVEDETLSCGTGVTAVAIAMNAIGKTNSESIRLNVEGGILEVSFTAKEGKYTNVFLKGPATFVFQGSIKL
jgi:diaminopimelate epimerase